NNPNVKAISANPFRIKGKVVLDQPTNAGISWIVGSTQTIKWTPTGTFSNVDLHYATDGNFGGSNVFGVLPATTVTNPASGVQGTASWVIPDKIGALVKVRV